MPTEPKQDRVDALLSIYERADEKLSVEMLCAGATELIPEVRRQIEAIEHVRDLLVPRPQSATAALSPMPAMVGRYRLIRPVGTGGMGVVYEAEQDRPRRRVAVKLLPPGVVSPGRLRRFELEAEVLGRLSHPGIVVAHEAGVAAVAGVERPFLAMEFVDGQTLGDHVRAHDPPRRQRLELLAAVCDAVNHAHRNGIVHRDLKPSNLMVDVEGRPRVLDFGVARLSDADSLAITAPQTFGGEVIGTWTYMAPEQADADAAAVGPAADVYALGVVAYELLAGRPPHDLAGLSLSRALHMVREVEPVPLGHLDRSLRGDLQTIVSMAMAKGPGRRYAGADALAADLRRHLNGEPVAARPPTLRYRAWCFARRRPALVGGVATTLLALLVGLAATTFLYVRAERERAVAEATTQFVLDVIASADPHNALGRELTVREVLDIGAARLESRYSSQPLVEASLRHTLGLTYLNLGVFDTAAEQFRRAAESRRRTSGANDSDAIDSLSGEFAAVQAAGRLAEAEPLAREVLERYDRTKGREHSDSIGAVNNLAVLLANRGDYPRAEAMFRDAVRRYDETLGAGSFESLNARHSLAMVLWLDRRLDKAEPEARAVLTARRASPGPDDPETIKTADLLSSILLDAGRGAEAEPLLREVAKRSARVLGPDHPQSINYANNLATLLDINGEAAEAEALFRDALARYERTVGADHPDAITARENLALSLRDKGDKAGAAALLRDVLQRRRRVLGPEHPDTRRTAELVAALSTDGAGR